MKFSKENWKLGEFENWLEFNIYLVENVISDEKIIRLILTGLPNEFAPFSSFNNNGNYIEFKTLNDFFDNEFEQGKDLIVFAVDGSGNPFCFDKNLNYQIIIFDFDTEQKINVNENFAEFLESILEYRNFVKVIQEKYCENALFDCLYKNEDIEILRKQLQQINGNSLSEYWTNEIQLLIINNNACR